MVKLPNKRQVERVDTLVLIIGFAVAVGVVLPLVNGPAWLSIAALAVAFVFILTRDCTSNLAGYIATLSLQVPHGFGPFRSAVSDLFMVPVVVRAVVEAWRRGEEIPASTLTKPFALVVIAFGIATVVGIVETGSLTPYVLVNRDVGLLYLVAGYLALVRFAQSPERAMSVVGWFVVGMSIGNVAALLAVAFAIAGLENAVYSLDNLRMYGWIGSPNRYGGVLMTAALLELGLLASRSPAGGFRRLRWLNLWLMALALVLTVSRGTWLAVGFGTAAMFTALLLDRTWRRSLRPSYAGVVVLWTLVPALALGSILVANLMAGMPSWAERTEKLRELSQTQQVPDVAGAGGAAEIGGPVETGRTAEIRRAEETGTAERASAAEGPPARRSPLKRSLNSALGIDGSVMNARGLQDRGAILGLAWSDYVQSSRSMLLGIGLGTFFVTSEAHFGIPLILHNTFAWFLIELGPLGLFALLWVWGQTGRNLWIARAASDGRRELVLGLIGAFAAMTAFWVINEGFYQRHFWLVLLLADRVRTLPSWSSADLSPSMPAAPAEPAPVALSTETSVR